MRRVLRASLSVALACVCGACVTEIERPRGRGSPFRTADTSRVKQHGAGADGSMTQGVVQAADAQTSSARVQLEVLPLGAIVYNALTLPLVSPDGGYLVAQQGMAPGWDELLATNDARPRSDSRLVVHKVAARSLAPLAAGPDFEPGLLLGRDADNAGFLVECVRGDATRWIGKCEWTTGRITWMAQGDVVHAHGALLRDGTLVCSRRKPHEWRASIVLGPGASSESVASLENASLLFPTPVPDSSSVVCVAAISDGTLELVVIAIEGDDSGVRRLGGVTSRRTLGRFDDPSVAYQVFAAMQPSSWAHPSARGVSKSIVFTHPATGRAGWIDTTRGQIASLPRQCVACAAWHQVDASGGGDAFLCTMPDELAFVPVSSPGETMARPVRVLPGPWVARVVSDGVTTDLILLGPDRSRADRIEIVRARLGAPSAR